MQKLSIDISFVALFLQLYYVFNTSFFAATSLLLAINNYSTFLFVDGGQNMPGGRLLNSNMVCHHCVLLA